MSEKKHAADFIADYIRRNECGQWLRTLVAKVIGANGPVPSEVLQSVFQEFLNSSEKTRDGQFQLQPAGTSGKGVLRLESLTHHSGCNALVAEGRIEFVSGVTTVFGRNGSGKSGYFRILNELAGGNCETPIRGNVYVAEQKPIAVEVCYKIGSERVCLIWDGSTRGIKHLKRMRVFDSSYLEGLLDRHQADAFVVTPYGLHLFKVISDHLDELKGRLLAYVDKLKCSLPQVDTREMPTLGQCFVPDSIISDEQKAKIEAAYSFSEGDSARLSAVEAELKELKSVNVDALVVAKRREYKELNSAKGEICRFVKDLAALGLKWNKVIMDLRKAETAAAAARERNKLLEGIPGAGTQQWRQFVDAAESYKRVAGDLEGRCPYCWQRLEKDALNVVEAYAKFLGDSSMATLRQAQAVVSSAKDDVIKARSRFEAMHWTNDVISSAKDSKQRPLADLFEAVRSAVERGLSAIETSVASTIPVPDSSNVSTAELEEASLDVESSIISMGKSLCAERDKKAERIKALEGERIALVERKSVSTQKDAIKKYFELGAVRANLSGRAVEFSTTHFTSLSKTAAEELVNDGVRERFAKFYGKFGVGPLELELKTSSSKGQNLVDIRLKGADEDLPEVLSEGEQKAVALSLFLAEANVAESHAPLVFDDPVTSLDSYIVDKFSELLCGLDTQVIVFTHNDYFRQKLECIRAGAPKFVDIEAGGRDSKGVVVESREGHYLSWIQNAQKLTVESSRNDRCGVLLELRQAVVALLSARLFGDLERPTRTRDICWEKLLKRFPACSKQISDLKAVHSRLSGGWIHLGLEREQAPIQFEELQRIAQTILRVDDELSRLQVVMADDKVTSPIR